MPWGEIIRHISELESPQRSRRNREQERRITPEAALQYALETVGGIEIPDTVERVHIEDESLGINTDVPIFPELTSPDYPGDKLYRGSCVGELITSVVTYGMIVPTTYSMVSDSQFVVFAGYLRSRLESYYLARRIRNLVKGGISIENINQHPILLSPVLMEITRRPRGLNNQGTGYTTEPSGNQRRKKELTTSDLSPTTVSRFEQITHINLQQLASSIIRK